MTNPVTLRVLGGGATQRLVWRFAEDFERQVVVRLDCDFGAVGGMRDRVLAGEAVDLILLTEEIVDALAQSGRVQPASKRVIGPVATSVAVRAGDRHPALARAADVATALRAADEIHFPDPERATAGIHFHKVLSGLGLLPEIGDKLRTHPNGMTAMGALARSMSSAPMGCTQTTEILATPGVELVAELPTPLGLRTLYCGAVCTTSPHAALAESLLDTLVAEEHAGFRADIGFQS